eukprot:765187-Hanusia_phi.AAC.3
MATSLGQSSEVLHDAIIQLSAGDDPKIVTLDDHLGHFRVETFQRFSMFHSDFESSSHQEN